MSRPKFYALLLLAASAVAGACWALRVLVMGLPDIRALEYYTPSLTTQVFDVKGEVTAELSIEKRALLPLSMIPVDLQNAVLSVEDDQFFRHWGISPKGILRSAAAN